MGFAAQSFTVAIAANGIVAQLKITVGNMEYVYDGSEAVDVVINDGTEVSY